MPHLTEAFISTDSPETALTPTERELVILKLAEQYGTDADVTRQAYKFCNVKPMAAMAGNKSDVDYYMQKMSAYAELPADNTAALFSYLDEAVTTAWTWEQSGLDLTKAEMPTVKRGLAAREALQLSNWRLVVWAAENYKGRGLDTAELIQEGNIGLLRSLSRFDTRRGYLLSTYGAYVIKRTINRAVLEKGRAIRLSRDYHHFVSEVMKTRNFLGEDYQQEPTSDQIAVFLDKDVKDVEAAIASIPTHPIRLDQPLSDGSATIMDWLGDEAAMASLESSTQAIDRPRLINRIINESKLDDRQKAVLCARFGSWLTQFAEIDGKDYPELVQLANDADEDGLTARVIGEKLGLTRQRIHQIEDRAKEKIATAHPALPQEILST